MGDMSDSFNTVWVNSPMFSFEQEKGKASPIAKDLEVIQSVMRQEIELNSRLSRMMNDDSSCGGSPTPTSAWWEDNSSNSSMASNSSGGLGKNGGNDGSIADNKFGAKNQRRGREEMLSSLEDDIRSASYARPPFVCQFRVGEPVTNVGKVGASWPVSGDASAPSRRASTGNQPENRAFTNDFLAPRQKQIVSIGGSNSGVGGNKRRISSIIPCNYTPIPENLENWRISRQNKEREVSRIFTKASPPEAIISNSPESTSAGSKLSSSAEDDDYSLPVDTKEDIYQIPEYTTAESLKSQMTNRETRKEPNDDCERKPIEKPARKPLEILPIRIEENSTGSSPRKFSRSSESSLRKSVDSQTRKSSRSGGESDFRKSADAPTRKSSDIGVVDKARLFQSRPNSLAPGKPERFKRNHSTVDPPTSLSLMESASTPEVALCRTSSKSCSDLLEPESPQSTGEAEQQRSISPDNPSFIRKLSINYSKKLSLPKGRKLSLNSCTKQPMTGSQMNVRKLSLNQTSSSGLATSSDPLKMEPIRKLSSVMKKLFPTQRLRASLRNSQENSISWEYLPDCGGPLYEEVGPKRDGQDQDKAIEKHQAHRKLTDIGSEGLITRLTMLKRSVSCDSLYESEFSDCSSIGSTGSYMFRAGNRRDEIANLPDLPLPSQPQNVEIQDYVGRLLESNSSAIGHKVTFFINDLVCSNKSAQELLKEVRECIESVKQQLITTGEGELHQLINAQRKRLSENQFLDISEILERVVSGYLLDSIHPLLTSSLKLEALQLGVNTARQTPLLAGNFAATAHAHNLNSRQESEIDRVMQSGVESMMEAVCPRQKTAIFLACMANIMTMNTTRDLHSILASLKAEDLVNLYIQNSYIWGLLDTSILSDRNIYFLYRLASFFQKMCGRVGEVTVMVPEYLTASFRSIVLPIRHNIKVRELVKMVVFRGRLTAGEDYVLAPEKNTDKSLEGEDLLEDHCKLGINNRFIIKKLNSSLLYQKV